MLCWDLGRFCGYKTFQGPTASFHLLFSFTWFFSVWLWHPCSLHSMFQFENLCLHHISEMLALLWIESLYRNITQSQIVPCYCRSKLTLPPTSVYVCVCAIFLADLPYVWAGLVDNYFRSSFIVNIVVVQSSCLVHLYMYKLSCFLSKHTRG